MSDLITVEGTETPSTFLAAGERRSVARTEFIDKLIRGGFIREVQPARAAAPPIRYAAPAADYVDETETVRADDRPAGNASTDTWRAYLDARGIEWFEEDTRADLIARAAEEV